VKPPVSVTGPPAVVTTTLAAPVVPEGVVMEIEVAASGPTVAGWPPTVTEVADNRFVPPMTTLVPPAVGPEAGLTAVIVGGTHR